MAGKSPDIYMRLIKILIRTVLVHEESYKFRRDVVGALRAFEFNESEFRDVPCHENH